MPEPVNYGRFGFTVRKATLALLCDQAFAAVPTSHPALPVYGCFRVTARDGKLELVGTDMRRTVWASTETVVLNGHGQAYVPARWLRDILAEAGDGEDVLVSVSGSQAVAKSGTARWTKKLPAPRSYPELPSLDGLELAPVPREPLLAALKTVRHAVGKDLGRPEYTQVHIDQAAAPGGGKEWFACASDSSQYCRAPVPGFPFPVNIPAAALEDLLRLLAVPVENAQVGQAGGALVFRAGPVTFAVIRIGTDFPDEEGTVLEPARQACADALAVDKARLRLAVRRVRISSDDVSSAIMLTARPGELTVESRDEDGNDARDVVPARWDHPERSVVLSGRVLEAVMAAHPSPECVFRLGTDSGRVLSRVLLEDEDAQVTSVLMQLGRRDAGY